MFLLVDVLAALPPFEALRTWVTALLTVMASAIELLLRALA